MDGWTNCEPWSQLASSASRGRNDTRKGFDQYVYRNDEHDGPSTPGAIVAGHQGEFGVDRDSQSSIAIEGGRVGGIIVGAGSALKVAGDIETEFYYVELDIRES